MTAARIVEPVYVFEDRHLGLPPRFPRPSPDQFSFEGLEERLDGGVVVTIILKPMELFKKMYAEKSMQNDLLKEALGKKW